MGEQGQIGVGVIRDEAFSKRLKSAISLNPHAPDGHGRIKWLHSEMARRSGDDEAVSIEAVRRWIAGIMRPRPAKMTLIAQILEVNEAWLSLGISGDLNPRERRARNAEAEGAVNLIAGLIQLSGGHPAFPDDNDRRAKQDCVDMYAIIKGASFAIHVSYCQEDKCKFSVPNGFEDLTVIGVMKGEGFSFTCYELDAETIKEFGNKRGGSIELDIPAYRLDALQIKSFAQRNFGRE